ncbi:hypothetical protein E4L96_03295 [Massilia arenosa]|uniref:Uncharacterized protein n=1 Tax=Zemynaea arenosa TaxID=2561931 RepID=A0A4Y9SMY3_9BURK|nr:hypothetical protein [Massilia arenosa]TFW27801.1 hypothetical protein E4L96_03295 [Massilia arenosa]
MNQQKQQHGGSQNGHSAEAGSPAWMDEPDIGSGEKTPGEKETEAIVRSVPATGQGTDGNIGAEGGQQEGSKQ